MSGRALQPASALAEDRATQRCAPSADPGAKTEEPGCLAGQAPSDEVRAVSTHDAARPSSLRDWHQSDQPSRQEAATSPTGSRPQLANTQHPKFQFPLNQDSTRGLERTVPRRNVLANASCRCRDTNSKMSLPRDVWAR